MWKSSIQRTFTPAPIKTAPDTAPPPTITFNPRPLARPTVSHRLEQVDLRAPPPIPLPSRSRPSDRDVTCNPSYHRRLSGTATRPTDIAIAPRPKLQGLVIYVEWGRGQTNQEFFAFLGRIRDHVGLTTNSLTDPTITHFLLSGSTEDKKQAYTYSQVTRRCKYKYQHVIRDHSKWFLPGCKALDAERNEVEKRTKMVVLKGWLWDVLDGKSGVEEEGKWGIYLKPEVDERRGQGLDLNYNEDERPSKNRQEAGSATSSRIAFNESRHCRNDSRSSGYLVTPPPSTTPLHAGLDPTIIKVPTSPVYRERSSPEDWAASSYIVTPPSATIALPDPATGPIKSTLLPIRQIEFCPPQNHRKYTSPPIHPNVQSTTGLFTPPSSASPPPVMRSPDYIMIPKSHFASEAYVWRPPSEEEVVDSPKYEDLPSPVNEDVASPSYSPIPTLSDPGTPPPIGLEVTVETPIVEKNEDTMVSVNTQVAEASIRPPASRQVSFGIKRPRPRSPVGNSSDDRPLAKRQSLPCMQSRSSSRSDSPMTPPPDEEMLEEEENDEEVGRFDEDFEDGNNAGVMANEEDEAELEEDEERSSSRASPSPPPSLSHYSDFDSGCEIGCQPVEFDQEPDVSSTCKISDLISKSVDEIDLKTFDLGKLLLECDITDELAGLLDVWI